MEARLGDVLNGALSPHNQERGAAESQLNVRLTSCSSSPSACFGVPTRTCAFSESTWCFCPVSRSCLRSLGSCLRC